MNIHILGLEIPLMQLLSFLLSHKQTEKDKIIFGYKPVDSENNTFIGAFARAAKVLSKYFVLILLQIKNKYKKKNERSLTRSTLNF